MAHNAPRKKALFLPSDALITACQTLLAPLARCILWVWGGYTIHVKLPQRLRLGTRYVIAANHQSMLDPFALFALLPLKHRLHIIPIKFMTFPKVYHKPYLKPFLFALGCFPAHAKDWPHRTHGVDGSIALLNRGYNICIFPEGTRTLRHQSTPRSGVSRILAAHPEAQLLVAHIEWTVYSPFRRHVNITIGVAPAHIDRNDPKAIVDYIYRL